MMALSKQVIICGFLVGCLILSTLLSFGHGGQEHGTPAATVGSLGPVALKDQTKKDLRITTEEVGLRTVEKKLAVYGVVETRPQNAFWASTRISGRVVETHVNAGDTVRKGDTLAEVESRQVAETPTRIAVTSLISGTVTERNISVGQPVEPDFVLFRVMDLHTVYVRLDIYEPDAGQIRVGQRAILHPDSSPHKTLEGPVVRIGGALDERTWTLPVWVEVPNPETKLRPGMRVRAELVTQTSPEVVTAPRRAILGSSGNLFMFIDKGNYYVGQPISIGLRGEEYIEVTDGLLPGDLVVTLGSYQLQFAAGNASTTAPSAVVFDGDSKSEEPAVIDDHLTAPDGVRLSDSAQHNLGIQTHEINFRTINKTATCFGTFVPIPAQVHHISTRIAGRVTQVYVAEGQHVRNGQLVAKIETLQVADPPPIIQARSTLSGVVIQSHVFPGEPIEPNTSLFTIAKLDQLLVKCHVYEADLQEIKVGQEARIHVEAFQGSVFEGRVEYFGGQIDPETRTLLAFVRVNNPERTLRPNMRAEVHLITGRRNESIAAPLAAVLDAKSNNPSVFVQTGEFFKRQSVVLGQRDDRYYEILDGLLPGDMVAVQGVYDLEFATNSPAIPKPGPPPEVAAASERSGPPQEPVSLWREWLQFWK